MRSYGLFLSLLLFLSFTGSRAQVVQRNLLQPFTSDLRTTLIPGKDFHPFPLEPMAWAALLPDSMIRKLIGEGEGALKFEFRSIPATLTLEFVRTGNRVRYEHASFDKRNALCALVLAEVLEH